MREVDAKTRLAAAATTQVKASPGRVKGLIVTNVGTSMTIDVYDDASANNSKVLEYVSADGKVNWQVDIPMTAGIRVVVGGTPGLAVLEDRKSVV